ncbi:hypothetical protein OVA24_17205 [Luteolibacter sp. SL250]|uniref:hypothetical protein n=1 Tax=Luteolibacter sp. SL250 TaxID=2995170 RepID=UPI00226EEF6B|nr:hypothetical protein [Luteolibacter sp. SL250]WAC18971.1 hypothetical protein OVA24_17205 [Luteolibacter sp. SL250]
MKRIATHAITRRMDLRVENGVRFDIWNIVLDPHKMRPGEWDIRKPADLCPAFFSEHLMSHIQYPHLASFVPLR